MKAWPNSWTETEMTNATRYSSALRICSAETSMAATLTSRPGEKPVVEGAQVAARQVRVDLGRADVGVAQHGLHGAQIGAALDEVGRERVPQLVRRDALA